MKKLGVILLLIGVAMFIAFGGAGFVAFLFSTEIPLVVKAAVFCVVGGVALLVLATARETWGKKDKYEAIEK